MHPLGTRTNCNYTKEALDNVLRFVKAKEGSSRKFGISKSTLSLHINDKDGNLMSYEGPTILTAVDKGRIIERI